MLQWRVLYIQRQQHIHITQPSLDTNTNTQKNLKGADYNKMATGAVQIQLQTRNKSNASFEAVQYQQDMRHIAHYHNIKKSCLPIHVVQKITIICAPSGGVQQNLNIGAQLHIILYKKPPKHFF